MFGFVLVLVLVGMAVGVLIGNGILGTLIALAIASVSAFVSYWKSDSIALRMSRAVPADPVVYKRLHNLVEGLCIAGGLPKPRVYIVHDPAPNAFATGRNPKNAAIAVTTGLLEKMNRVELEGVVAHELSHIKNYDILVMTLAVTLVGTVAILTDIAIRMMWWNGGRVARAGDRDNRSNPLAFIGIALLILAPLLARAMQAVAPFAFGWMMDELGTKASLLVSAAVSLVALGALLAIRVRVRVRARPAAPARSMSVH